MDSEFNAQRNDNDVVQLQVQLSENFVKCFHSTAFKQPEECRQKLQAELYEYRTARKKMRAFMSLNIGKVSSLMKHKSHEIIVWVRNIFELRYVVGEGFEVISGDFRGLLVG